MGFMTAWGSSRGRGTEMLMIPDVTMVDQVFGGDKALEIMPKMKDIPDDFPNKRKWEKVMSDWFFLGMKNAKWTPKTGVETKKALAVVLLHAVTNNMQRAWAAI